MAAAAACIGRRSRRKGTPHASLLNSNSERKSEREGEREREQQQKLGRKEKNLEGWKKERRERESWEESPKNNAPLALPAPPKDLLRRIIWQSVGSATSPVASQLLSFSPSRSRGAKSETIKRGEICSVKRKAEATRRWVARKENRTISPFLSLEAHIF